ncbi:MAG: TonB-dependent receptor, partial [Bacteroidales bacterium]|nr:TonB-dependent receptor [Bacteroidales bacterium]
PWHSGSAVVGLDWRRWHLNYSFIYTGERYESVANIPENHAQPWYTSDLSLSRTFQTGNSQLKGTLEVNNLFNQQYEVVQCYPMPGTNFRLILSWIL